MSRSSVLGVAVILLATIFCAGSAHAVPILQLYLEGGTYNDVTESWELTQTGTSAGEPFRLWAIGNVDGPGGSGAINEVRLSVVYDSQFDGLINIALAGSTTGGFGGFTDPSTPADPTWLQKVTDGSQPVLYGGNPLPSHGVYGSGRVWEEYLLGDLTATDSPVGDFIDDFPTAIYPDSGQINVYEVSVTGGHDATIHFDLYNHVTSATRGKFAPFSHDADGDSNIVPEPATAVIWSLLGLLGLVAIYRRRDR